MNTLRQLKKINITGNEELVFQCLEWSGTNEGIQIENSKYRSYQYVIKLFGVTAEGHSISVNNNNFEPYFFVKIPDNYTYIHKKKIIDKIKSKLEIKYSKAIVSSDIVERKDFYGFTNNKLFKFIKFVFKNSVAMNKVNHIIREGLHLSFGNKSKLEKYKIYESNISPFLRFIHEKDLKAAGWVRIPPNTYKINNDIDRTSNCQIDVDIDFDTIEFVNRNDIAPMIIASFDIECSSSHGDFPLAKKNYKKLACEIYDSYINSDKSLKKMDVSDKILFINSLINLGFNIPITELLNNKNKSENNILKNLITSVSREINLVYTENYEKPEKYRIDKLSKIIYKIINNKENYKILVSDILKYFYDTNYPQINMFKHKYIIYIKSILEDAFTNEVADKSNKMINTIYTNTNSKPSKKIIEVNANKITKQISILFKKIKKTLCDYDIDGDLINDFIDIFIKNNEETFEKKIDIFVEEFDISRDYFNIIINDINVCFNMIYSYLNDFPEIDSSRDTYCKRIITKLDTFLPKIEGDKVIQIGTTIQKYGEKHCYLKHIITLNTCTDIDGAIVESYDNEKDVLLAWRQFIHNLDPDIITGYNIFGFDFSFMWARAEELECLDEFCKLGRVRRQFNDEETNILSNDTKKSRLEIKKLASSALGDNLLKYITMEGRIVMDLFKIVQKDFNLVSYKLDYVAENFINDKIKDIDGNILVIDGINTLNKGHFITINYGHDKKYKKRKFKIDNINFKENTITINFNIPEDDKNIIMNYKPKWTLAKDDVSPKDIFRLQDGTADDRKIVATYCIQDCALCNNLIDKLKIITNNIGMANVCFVPISYLFLRGQGVKIFSLVSNQCRKDGFLVPVLKYENEEIIIKDDFKKFEYGESDETEILDNEESYEGAIVLEPKPDIYLDKSVTVLDYASLYPSSMISENISQDSIILDNENNIKYMGEKGKELLNNLGYGVEDITRDVFKWKNPKIKSQGKIKCGEKTCRFVQPLDGSKSVIPRILKNLLKARKDTRKKIKYKSIILKNGKEVYGLLSESKCGNMYIILDENGNKTEISKNDIKNDNDIKDKYNDFEKSVYDGLQLAFKLTANSLYGQMGAKTSPICMIDVAASTTATGRKLLYLARDKVKEHFKGAEIVYGDTDSIFINFNPRNENGKLLKNKEALEKSIKLGVEAEKYIQPFLKAPHRLEYEKTFWPFILFSKKRYIGNKYEFKIGDNDYKETSMGIVLKRRDNADIVKHVYGDVIDILINKRDLKSSILSLQSELMKLLDGKFSLDMLVITKSLRGYYKNPKQIAHKVLADRMGIRDPGNKPSSNDRIPYVYIQVKESKGKSILQGDRIEHIDYIKEHNIKPDYAFYITNQIMKPVAQIYSLIVEKLDGFKYPKDYYEKKYITLLKTKDKDKAKKKIEELKFKEASKIIFGEILRIADNRKKKATEITDFFSKK